MRIAVTTIARVFALSALTLGQRSVAGRVAEVIDGKTLVLATETGRSTVELQYIEVPREGKMGDTVRDHLRLLTVGKKAVYIPRLIRDDRSAGVLEIESVDMAGQMLRDGAAWHVPATMSGQRSSESDYYASLESAAKNENRGIWADPTLTPPWTSTERVEVSSVIKASETGAKKQPPPKNPRLGDTGMLLNGYDPASRTGYLSTSLFGIQPDPNPIDDTRFAIDFSYYYKEDASLKRTGSFVLTLISDASKPVFDKDGSIVLYGGGSPVTISAGKRLVRIWDGRIVEKVYFKLDRSVLERIVNNNSAFLKVRNHMLIMTGARYLLYTMLQVTS